MGSYYLEQVKNFVDEFTNIYEADFYVSKKVIDSFFDKYNDIYSLCDDYPDKDNKLYKKLTNILKYGYELIDQRNLKYIDIKLNKEKEYFDNLFKDIDPNIKLDDEQRRAIIIDEDYSLIVAGAGSGKTTTMAAKVKYLVERRGVNPKEIILLSFTNDSVNDLNNLINEKFKLGIEVLTFHKLGMKFLRGTSASTLEIIGIGGKYKILEEYFLNVIFKNKEFLKEHIDLFEMNIDESAYEYETFDEYYDVYVKRKLIECTNYQKELRERVKNRAKQLKTINGEYVKSKGEFEIANYLYKQSIDYQYEALYPYPVGDNRAYKPDFTINDFGRNIYIEYYGLAKLMKNNTIYSEFPTYKKEINQKRKNHHRNGTRCIELFGRYEEDNYHLRELSRLLTINRVPKKEREPKELLRRVLETSKTQKYAKLLIRFEEYISIFKEKGYSVEDFEDLIREAPSETLKRQLLCFKEAYIYYETYIRKFNRIDFEDMINIAYRNVEETKRRMRLLNYKYIVIDEYQDVSLQRHNLTKKISDVFDSKIVAVGDDWQSIFSFSGSNLDLFVKFEENMGYCATTKILNTYRNSQELIDIAGEFILKNEYQIEKKLKSNKSRIKPVRIVKYEENDMYRRLINLLKKIYKNHPEDNILLLARYNHEIDDLASSANFYMPNRKEKQIICSLLPEAKIEISTVHRSKGLGYDRVILLNGKDNPGGFPSDRKDDEVMTYLKGNTIEDIADLIEYPEERRLFYVAMTRTKNEFYILTPSEYIKRSPFIQEIELYKNVAMIDKEIE